MAVEREIPQRRRSAPSFGMTVRVVLVVPKEYDD